MNSPFVRIDTSKYCPYCQQESIALIVNQEKRNKVAEKFRCKLCHREFMIDWTCHSDPRPIILDMRFMACTHNKNEYL